MVVSKNHQRCWWFQKALALPSKLSERSEEPTRLYSQRIKQESVSVIIKKIEESPTAILIAAGRIVQATVFR